MQSPLEKYYQAVKGKMLNFESLERDQILFDDLLRALKIVADVSDRDFEDRVDWEEMLKKEGFDELALLELQLTSEEVSAFILLKRALSEPDIFKESSINRFVEDRKEVTRHRREVQSGIETREQVLEESREERIKLASDLWDKFISLNWGAKTFLVAGSLLFLFLGKKLAGKILQKLTIKEKLVGVITLAGVGVGTLMGLSGIRKKINSYFGVPTDLAKRGLDGLEAAKDKLESGINLLKEKKQQVEKLVKKDNVKIDSLEKLGYKEPSAREKYINEISDSLGLSGKAKEELKKSKDTVDIIDCLVENDIIPVVKDGVIHLVVLGAKTIFSAGLLLFSEYKDSLKKTADAYKNRKYNKGGAIRVWFTEGIKYGVLFGSKNVAMKFISNSPKYTIFRGVLQGLGWPVTIPAFVYRRVGGIMRFASMSLKTGKFAVESVSGVVQVTKKVAQKAPKVAGLAKSVSKRLEKEVTEICSRAAEKKLVKKIIKKVAIKKAKKLVIKRGMASIGGLLGSPIVSGAILIWGLYDIGMLTKDLYDQYERLETIKDKNNPLTKFELDESSRQKIDQAVSEGVDEIEAFRGLKKSTVTIKREGLEGKEVWSFENGQMKDVETVE